MSGTARTRSAESRLTTAAPKVAKALEEIQAQLDDPFGPMSTYGGGRQQAMQAVISLRHAAAHLVKAMEELHELNGGDDEPEADEPEADEDPVDDEPARTVAEEATRVETRREGHITRVLVDGEAIGYVESVGGTWWLYPTWDGSDFRVISGARYKAQAVQDIVEYFDADAPAAAHR